MNSRGFRCGVLLQPGGLWIGAHWSSHNRRWCINLLPCVTIWIALPGGKAPSRAARYAGDMDRALWIDRFVMRMSELGVRANPEFIADMAAELYPATGHLDPVAVADAEWADGPPHDD